MAIAERHLAARFNRPGHTVVDHHTYVLCSDGDLMEGVAAEASSLAGHLGLGKLIALYDDNQVSLAGKAALSFSEDVPRRFEGLGWHTQAVPDGNDLDAIDKAIRAARAETGAPVSHRGADRDRLRGAEEGRNPRGPRRAARATRSSGARSRRSAGRSSRRSSCRSPRVAPLPRGPGAAGRGRRPTGSARLDAWRQALPGPRGRVGARPGAGAHPGLGPGSPALPGGRAGGDPRRERRRARRRVARACRIWWAATPTSRPSTKTLVKTAGSFLRGTPEGRHLHFGVREHAMGSIANGITYHGGLLVFCGTFFVFSDYMRPAVRLAALSELPVVYVWTHDSIGVGEDGPTHEPVEHLAALRAMPNLVVIRPGDAAETVVAWQVALARRHGPTALVLTRQKVPVLDRDGLRAGRGPPARAPTCSRTRPAAPPTSS